MFTKSGNIIRSIDSNQVLKYLPTDCYSLSQDMNGVFLKTIEVAKPVSKIYGNLDKKANRIIDTYFSRTTKNTGVLLRGERGSGKSLLTKIISDKLLEKDVSTIVINSPIDPEALNTFINAIKMPVVIIFDEFEKTFNDEEMQEKMLTLLDGVYGGNKLYLFTINKFDYITEMLKNRPGRIFYSYEFKGLDENFIREYCEENFTESKNKNKYIENVIKISSIFNNFNFDMLSALVEESNRYDEDPKDFIEFMNISPINYNSKKYNAIIFVDGKEIKDHSYNEFYYNFPNEYKINFFEDEDQKEYTSFIIGLSTMENMNKGNINFIGKYKDKTIKIILNEIISPMFDVWDRTL